MKKLFFAVVAAASLMFAACGGSSTGGSSNEPLVAVDASVKLDKTFENDKFSVSYPSLLQPGDVMGSDFYFNDESGAVSFNGTFGDGGPTASQLQVTAEGMVGALRATGDTPEEPKVNSNGYVIKSMSGEKVKWSYLTLKEDGVYLMGNLEYPKEQAAEYEKYVGAMLQSIKFK